MKKVLLIGFIVVILIAIPLTIYLVGLQTQTQTKAEKSTNLTFSQLSGPVTVGQKFNLNVLLDPGNNQVSFVKLIISYDSTKLKRGEPGISPNTSVFPVTLEGPTYDQCTGTTCTESITLSIGTEVTKAIQGGGSPVTIASVNFEALAATETDTSISFGNGTQVLSLATSDEPSENVLATANPAAITISGPTTPTPGTPTPTSGDGGGDGTGGTPSPTTPTNQDPICTSLTADKTSTTSAPLNVTFTANGNDADGTIVKATFNFGDGSVQEASNSAALNTISSQIQHAYQTDGLYTATVTLTDDLGGISNPTACSQTISVGSTALSTTPTPPLEALPDTGPNEVILLIGIAGVVVMVVGGVLLFGL